MSKEPEAAVKSAEFRDKMVPSGIESEQGTTANFGAFITAERDRLGHIAKKANMQADKWEPTKVHTVPGRRQHHVVSSPFP